MPKTLKQNSESSSTSKQSWYKGGSSFLAPFKNWQVTLLAVFFAVLGIYFQFFITLSANLLGIALIVCLAIFWGIGYYMCLYVLFETSKQLHLSRSKGNKLTLSLRHQIFNKALLHSFTQLGSHFGGFLLFIISFLIFCLGNFVALPYLNGSNLSDLAVKILGAVGFVVFDLVPLFIILPQAAFHLHKRIFNLTWTDKQFFKYNFSCILSSVINIFIFLVICYGILLFIGYFEIFNNLFAISVLIPLLAYVYIAYLIAALQEKLPRNPLKL